MTRHTRFALIGALAVLGACQDLPDPTAPLGGAPAPQFSQAAQEGGPDRMALARAVPGFAGIFFENGQPTVALTDVGQRPAAERALTGFLRAQGFGPGALQVRSARWDYATLDGWYRSVWPEAFAGGGIVYTGLNELRNAIVIGVEDGARIPAVRAIAARLGVPAEAVQVEETEPIVQLASLRDRATELRGGLQIHFGNYLCTLGFPALSGSDESFITNSHCTNRQGGTEGTIYYQPLSSVDGTAVGIEVNDPDYFTGGGCPQGSKCRYSDSSRALRQGPRPSARGQIAKPANQSGSLEIAGAFTITGKYTQPGVGTGCVPIGTVVHKVGRTTGWSSGQVTNTCINVGVRGSNIVQLDQVIVAARIDSGDSGSPAFSIQSGDNVTLQGIVWGGSSTTLVFSPITNVEYELGPLTVTSGGGGPGPSAPATPGNFRVTSTSTSSIGLAWNDVSGEDRYELTRSPGTMTQLGANTTSYGDGGLAANATYDYSLVACSGALCSAPATLTVTTDPESPVSGSTMHVAAMSGSSSIKGKSGKWSASAVVTIEDESGNPVAGATVEVSVSGGGALSGTTASDGTVTLTTGNLTTETQVTITVQNVTHPSLTYDAGANVADQVVVNR